MAKAVKLADIAERVGVSTVTVSKALSGQKGVSEEVREKIRSIAEELGYQQPSAARKSQNQKSYNIGILISERFLDKYESFYWQMYQAVATRATAKECFTMLEVIGMPEEENGRMPKLVQERKVDGIIVIGKMMDTYLQHLNTETQPFLHTKTKTARDQKENYCIVRCVFGSSNIDRRRRSRSRQLHLLF